MNCIIIEDEPAAQSILLHHLSFCPDMRCMGVFANAFSAQSFLDTNPVDLIFLDINLPEMSGVSFLRSLVRPPMVIFTTAYHEYAVDGFDLEVVDFLLKPFSFERFCKALNKAREKFNLRIQPPTPLKLTVKSGKRIYQILADDILLVEACGDYVSIVCADKKLVVHGTLRSWEEKLSGGSFLKVHRTAIVNLRKVDHLEGNQLQVHGHTIPVSEQYKDQLLKQLFGS